MKRLWVVGAAVILLAAICGFGVMTVGSRLQDTQDMIKEIRAAAKADDIDRAVKLARQLDSDWVENEKVLKYFVSSKILTDVGVSVAKIAPLLSDGATADFYAELYAAQVQIKHIKNCEVGLFGK